MNPDKEEEVLAIWVMFSLGFYGYYDREMINIFEYASINCDLDAKYYWSSWSKDRQDEVIEMCYQNWVAGVVAEKSVQRWDVRLIQTEDNAIIVEDRENNHDSQN